MGKEKAFQKGKRGKGSQEKLLEHGPTIKKEKEALLLSPALNASTCSFSAPADPRESMYVVIAKRIRKYEKKLKQIEFTEEKQRSGIQLNKEQSFLVESKEKTLTLLRELQELREASISEEEERKVAMNSFSECIARILCVGAIAQSYISFLESISLKQKPDFIIALSETQINLLKNCELPAEKWYELARVFRLLCGLNKKRTSAVQNWLELIPSENYIESAIQSKTLIEQMLHSNKTKQEIVENGKLLKSIVMPFFENESLYKFVEQFLQTWLPTCCLQNASLTRGEIIPTDSVESVSSQFSGSGEGMQLVPASESCCPVEKPIVEFPSLAFFSYDKNQYLNDSSLLNTTAELGSKDAKESERLAQSKKELFAIQNGDFTEEKRSSLSTDNNVYGFFSSVYSPTIPAETLSSLISIDAKTDALKSEVTEVSNEYNKNSGMASFCEHSIVSKSISPSDTLVMEESGNSKTVLPHNTFPCRDVLVTPQIMPESPSRTFANSAVASTFERNNFVEESLKDNFDCKEKDNEQMEIHNAAYFQKVSNFKEQDFFYMNSLPNQSITFSTDAAEMVPAPSILNTNTFLQDRLESLEKKHLYQVPSRISYNQMLHSNKEARSDNSSNQFQHSKVPAAPFNFMVPSVMRSNESESQNKIFEEPLEPVETNALPVSHSFSNMSQSSDTCLSRVSLNATHLYSKSSPYFMKRLLDAEETSSAVSKHAIETPLKSMQALQTNEIGIGVDEAELEQKIPEGVDVTVPLDSNHFQFSPVLQTFTPSQLPPRITEPQSDETHLKAETSSESPMHSFLLPPLNDTTANLPLISIRDEILPENIDATIISNNKSDDRILQKNAVILNAEDNFVGATKILCNTTQKEGKRKNVAQSQSAWQKSDALMRKLHGEPKVVENQITPPQGFSDESCPANDEKIEQNLLRNSTIAVGDEVSSGKSRVPVTSFTNTFTGSPTHMCFSSSPVTVAPPIEVACHIKDSFSESPISNAKGGIAAFGSNEKLHSPIGNHRYSGNYIISNNPHALNPSAGIAKCLQPTPAMAAQGMPSHGTHVVPSLGQPMYPQAYSIIPEVYYGTLQLKQSLLSSTIPFQEALTGGTPRRHSPSHLVASAPANSHRTLYDATNSTPLPSPPPVTHTAHTIPPYHLISSRSGAASVHSLPPPSMHPSAAGCVDQRHFQMSSSLTNSGSLDTLTNSFVSQLPISSMQPHSQQNMYNNRILGRERRKKRIYRRKDFLVKMNTTNSSPEFSGNVSGFSRRGGHILPCFKF